MSWSKDLPIYSFLLWVSSPKVQLFTDCGQYCGHDNTTMIINIIITDWNSRKWLDVGCLWLAQAVLNMSVLPGHECSSLDGILTQYNEPKSSKKRFDQENGRLFHVGCDLSLFGKTVARPQRPCLYAINQKGSQQRYINIDCEWSPLKNLRWKSQSELVDVGGDHFESCSQKKKCD